MATNKPLLLHIFDDRVAFEKANDGSCLVVSRTVPDGQLDAYVDEKGRVLKELEGGQIIPIDAIFGIYHLLSGPYVALVLDSEIAVATNGMEFRKVTKVAVIPLIKTGLALTEERQKDEDTYLDLLHRALSSHHFYFSYFYDVTHTLQRTSRFTPQDKAKPLWQRADDRFFWNRELVQELAVGKSNDWIVPIMNAHVEYRPNCGIGTHRFHLLFVSRRSRYRQGCRFTMRGIDEDGNVANFVETEQAILHEDGRQTAFVQIRGSIPVLWNSPVCVKYTPKVFIADMGKSLVYAKKHFDTVVDLYGKEGAICVNLVNMKKDEQTLGIKYKEVVDKLGRNNVRYVWFDFHAECKKMKYENLKKLVNEVDEDFHKHGYFHRAADGTVTKFQKGVVRTNCMDNLDRTNVVQSLFARRSLLMQLEQQVALQGNVLESPFKDFEKVFKDVWGNNADAISVYYSGTGALKTDFTRTGKRTIQGAINDGINSCMRFYLNNFEDGLKQDSIDLMLGRYRPDPSMASPFISPPADQETLNVFLTKVFVCMVLTFSFLMLVRPKEKDLQTLFVVSLGITFLIFLLMVYNMIKKGGKMGKKLVRKPRLCPEGYIYSFYNIT